MTAAGLLLAGCWQSRVRPYRNVASLTPFAAGAVTETDAKGHVTHFELSRIAHDRYRLSQTDQGQDHGQGFELGFFPLRGAPSNVLIYQAAALDHSRADESLRYYGLMVVVGARSAREIRPDCAKDKIAARASGTVAGKDGACSFADRTALETSLLALWKSGKKPENTYALQ